MDDPQNNRAHISGYIKPCALFQTISEFKLDLQSGNAQFRSKLAIFDPCECDGWPWKTIGQLFYASSSFMHHFIGIRWFKLRLQSGNANFGSTSEIVLSRVTLKNNRPHLTYFKLCASFHNHRSFPTSYSREHKIRVEFGDFLSCVALRFNGLPWKIIWRLFYATSSYVHNFIAIGPFKLEFQSRNAKFGSKSAIFCPVSPCKLANDPDKKIGHLILPTSSIPHHFIAMHHFKLELLSGNAEFGWKSTVIGTCDFKIWGMTLKNTRAPLLCYLKLYAPFYSHRTIQTWVTANNCQIRVKIGDISIVHHFIAISEFRQELQSGYG